jgi:cation diffusion facilitator family transporter
MRAQTLASCSILVGLVVLALKTAAWWVTGSAGLFSDAVETVVNVAAAVLTLLAVQLAERPADDNHPYGHEKVELLAAIIEGVLIVVAAMLIMDQAWASFRSPAPLENLPIGLGLNAISTVINLAWALLLGRHGKRHRSPALLADGKHLMADVITSLSVLGGVGLVLVTHQVWLDPLVAVLAALYIIWSGVHLISESVGGLMDAAPPADIIEQIRRIVAEQAEGAIEAHDLRTRHAGRLTFMEFHLVVPGAMSVANAHVICDRIEAALKAELQGLMITIHVEPEGKAKHHGVLVL